MTNSTVDIDVLPADWREQVLRLADERDAVILAHNYQTARDLPRTWPIITGDSLALAHAVAAETDAST